MRVGGARNSIMKTLMKKYNISKIDLGMYIVLEILMLFVTLFFFVEGHVYACREDYIAEHKLTPADCSWKELMQDFNENSNYHLRNKSLTDSKLVIIYLFKTNPVLFILKLLIISIMLSIAFLGFCESGGFCP